MKRMSFLPAMNIRPVAWVSAFFVVCGVPFHAPAAGQPVGLALVLAMDASTSVSPWEYALQRAGLAAAFRDPEVIAAISSTGGDGIVVTLVQFAGAGEPATGPEDDHPAVPLAGSGLVVILE